MSIVIPLSKTGDPLFRQLYAGLRDAILSGGYRAGDRLPSTRALAEQVGVSRTVVLLAYEQLLAEGFVGSRGGSGTYVAEGVGGARAALEKASAQLRLSQFGAAAAEIAGTVDFPGWRPVSLRYDFAYGRGDVAMFPFETWRRLLLKHARMTPVRGHDYAAPAGSGNLREAIATHLHRSRGVRCDPSQVIVTNGSQQALDLIVRVLIERGDPVAIEEPQYQGVREVLRAAGAELQPMPVDRDGLDPARLPMDARLAFVTPSHQFPTGAILPLARRLALLRWAVEADAVVVEDDYDGEFRYEGQPVESLQGLDREGRVIYVGTFSRTIFSALRIGYLIVPTSLIAAFTAAKWLSDRHTPALEQQTLAEFITSGLYERHLRRLRRSNAARRQALVDAVGAHLGDAVRLTGDGAGAHVVLWPREGLSEDEVIKRAAERNVGLYGVSRYYIGAPTPGFLLGYSQLNADEIVAGIARLGEVLRG